MELGAQNAVGFGSPMFPPFLCEPQPSFLCLLTYHFLPSSAHSACYPEAVCLLQNDQHPFVFGFLFPISHSQGFLL